MEDEVVRLRVENTELKVKNGKHEETIFWLKAVIVAFFSACLVLLAALVVVPGIGDKRKSKKGSRKGSLLPLFRLLRTIMTMEEVTRVLDLYLGAEGREVLLGLSTATSPDDFFHRVLVALERRDLLNGAFFAVLIAFVPTRRDDILEVQTEFFASFQGHKIPDQ